MNLKIPQIISDYINAINSHEVEGFDYRLRPGVVQKSNALELMRLVGLDVTG